MTNDDFGAGDVDGTIEMFRFGSTGNVAPAIGIYGSCSSLDTPQGIAVDSAGNIYVANNGQIMSDPNIAVYPAGSAGCPTPTAVISGTAAGLVQPTGLTLDSTLKIYVTDVSANSVNVFSAGSTGNVAPIETIADPKTGMDNPLGIAFDSHNNIYVANAGSQDNAGGFDSVTSYPAGSYANVAPTTTIGAAGATPNNTGLNDPDAIALGSDNGIWVANALGGASGIGSLTWYPPGSNGNVAPQVVISGSNTGLNDPVGIAISTANNPFVLNASGGPDSAGSITVYLYTNSGNATPTKTIQGTSSSNQTGFANPSGLALDGSNNIYVTNDGSASGGSDSITIYAAGSNGNVAPMSTISGPLTQLNLPSGIAVDSGGNIYVANDGGDEGGIDAITIYPPGSNGNVSPLFNITGSLTGLVGPAGIAIDPSS